MGVHVWKNKHAATGRLLDAIFYPIYLKKTNSWYEFPLMWLSEIQMRLHLLCLLFTSNKTSRNESFHVIRQHICGDKSFMISLLMFLPLLFHHSLSLFISFSSSSLPQLMFPGFLSENLQHWVQCAHRRKHKRRRCEKEKTHPSCLMSACSLPHRTHM